MPLTVGVSPGWLFLGSMDTTIGSKRGKFRPIHSQRKKGGSEGDDESAQGKKGKNSCMGKARRE